MAIQNFNISAHTEQRRRIVNLGQTLRIFRLIPGKQPNSGGLRLGQFFGSGAKRLARVDRLRDGRGKRCDSSSMSEALKIRSGLPIALRSFPAMRAPRPGVKASANHPKYWSGHVEGEPSVRRHTECVKLSLGYAHLHIGVTLAVTFALMLVGQVVEGFEGQAEAVRLHSDGAAEGLVDLADG